MKAFDILTTEKVKLLLENNNLCSFLGMMATSGELLMSDTLKPDFRYEVKLSNEIIMEGTHAVSNMGDSSDYKYCLDKVIHDHYHSVITMVFQRNNELTRFTFGCK